MLPEEKKSSDSTHFMIRPRIRHSSFSTNHCSFRLNLPDSLLLFLFVCLYLFVSIVVIDRGVGPGLSRKIMLLSYYICCCLFLLDGVLMLLRQFRFRKRLDRHSILKDLNVYCCYLNYFFSIKHLCLSFFFITYIFKSKTLLDYRRLEI